MKTGLFTFFGWCQMNLIFLLVIFLPVMNFESALKAQNPGKESGSLIPEDFIQGKPLSPLDGKPLAHAHNDYLHKKPLFGALEMGFGSVEADVYLIKGELILSHGPPVFNKRRTLEELYLDPLLALFRRNRGLIYPGDSTVFYLMIDFKTGGKETYETLRRKLEKYVDMLVVYEDGIKINGAVRIVISGGRPAPEWLLAQKTRLTSLDGRPGDLNGPYDAELIPWISSRYGSVLKWRGMGDWPAQDSLQLTNLANRTNKSGRKLRLWASPEKPEVWKRLQAAEIGLISSDKLRKLNRFLTRE